MKSVNDDCDDDPLARLVFFCFLLASYFLCFILIYSFSDEARQLLGPVQTVPKTQSFCELLRMSVYRFLWPH